MIKMKKCDYCSKELESYHLQYCKDNECENLALAFYQKRRKTEKIFGIFNIICIIAIMCGLIMAVFVPVQGNIIVACALLVLCIVILALPFAPENFYQKYKIKKTILIVRIFGIGLFLASLFFAFLAFYYSTK